MTSAVSKKTKFLVVGDEPGLRKVEHAKRLHVKMVRLDDLVKGLVAEDVPSVPEHELNEETTAFSLGFRANGAKRIKM